MNAGFKKVVAENVSDLKPVMDGTSFAYTNLTIRNSGLKEITELIHNYEHLRKIDLSLNILKEIPALFNLKFVTDLNLERNQITSASFLSRQTVFPFLKKINFLGNRIDKLPIISSKNLKMVNLNYNLIDSLE